MRFHIHLIDRIIHSFDLSPGLLTLVPSTHKILGISTQNSFTAPWALSAGASRLNLDVGQFTRPIERHLPSIDQLLVLDLPPVVDSSKSFIYFGVDTLDFAP